MKQVLTHIVSCLDCPNRYQTYVSKSNDSRMCAYACFATGRRITGREIPKWCPLSDSQGDNYL